jgi:hypothetical protein
MNGPILRSDINTYVEQAKFADELMIGTKVCPPVPVNQIAGKYPILRIADGKLLQLQQPKPRAWSSEAPIIQTSWDVDGYECFDYSVKQRIDQVLSNYTSQFGFDQYVQAAKILNRWQNLKLEVDIANTLFNTSNFTLLTAATAYINANLGTPGSAVIGANVPQDIQAMYTQLISQGQNPGRATLVIPLAVYQYITRTQQFQYFVRGNRPADSYVEYAPTSQNLATLAGWLGVKDVLVAQSYGVTGNPNISSIEGNLSPQTAAVTNTKPIWSNSYMGLFIVGEGDFTAGGAARLLYYEQAGAMLSTLTYWLPQYRSTDIEVSLFSIPKVIDASSGVILSTGYTGS